eukprot:scaffold3448_cov107-Isochrysis_galbana.AAC.5
MQACADYIEPRGAWAFVLTVLKFRRRRSSTFLPPQSSRARNVAALTQSDARNSRADLPPARCKRLRT